MQREVIVYTSNGCSFCMKLKQFLNQHNVTYEERNVTVNPAFLEELTDKGIYSVPTVIWNGKPVPGYRPNKLTELMQQG